MKPLPIGIQHFDKLREEGYLYIDKTEFVHQLADRGGAFFYLVRAGLANRFFFLLWIIYSLAEKTFLKDFGFMTNGIGQGNIRLLGCRLWKLATQN